MKRTSVVRRVIIDISYDTKGNPIPVANVISDLTQTEGSGGSIKYSTSFQTTVAEIPEMERLCAAVCSMSHEKYDIADSTLVQKSLG